MTIVDRFPQALAHVERQAKHGPPFEPGLCKQQTRIAFGVPSDGSPDAATAWTRTRVRVPWPTPSRWRGGVILWWTGGSKGHGHVAFTDSTPGLIWTVDFTKPGSWGRVSLVRFEAGWRNLTRAGASLDIDGVQVRPRATGQPHIRRAIKQARKARDNATNPARKAALARVLAQLRKIKQGDYTP